MSAVLSYVPPRSSSPQRYPGKSEQEKARLIRAEVQFITRFNRAGLVHVNWKCHVCHAGRVLIEQKQTSDRRVIELKTKGRCSTPGCLDWED